MKLRLTAMILLSLCLSQAFADEGMWLLGNLRKNKQAERVMKELGLQMPVNKLYNPKKPALANAVVSFGGFCSGVVVSEDGWSGIYQSSLWFQQYPAAFFRRT